MNQIKPFSTITDKHVWDHYYSRLLYPSVYASYEYLFAAQLLERDDACAELAICQIDNFFLFHPYIKRTIPDYCEAKDIISAFDFGGFWFNTDDPDIMAELVSVFQAQFLDYCSLENIVTEFIRFYPTMNLQNLHLIYNISQAGDNVVLHLDDGYAELWNNYEPSLRKAVRKATRSELAPLRTKDLNTFINIYYENLDYLKAQSYYYFPREFLERIIQHLIIIEIRDKEGEICASHIYLDDNEILFAFLCHSRREKQRLRPNDFCYNYAIRELGFDRKILYLGGGRSELVRYKKKFSKNTLPYYVGRKVYNNALYETLTRHRSQSQKGTLDNTPFFPKYRSIIQ